LDWGVGGGGRGQHRYTTITDPMQLLTKVDKTTSIGRIYEAPQLIMHIHSHR
jgi:hypothetical protein